MSLNALIPKSNHTNQGMRYVVLQLKNVRSAPLLILPFGKLNMRTCKLPTESP